MNETPGRKIWQLHWATVIALLLVAGGVVWINTQLITKYARVPGAYYGWPKWHCVYRSSVRFNQPHWEFDVKNLAIDAGIWLGLLFSVGLPVEVVQRLGLPRLHLSTGIVTVMFVGILIGANTDWSMPFFDYFNNSPYGDRDHYYYLGWPLDAYFHNTMSQYTRVYYEDLTKDVVVNLFLVFVVTFLTEFLVRRRTKKSGKV